MILKQVAGIDFAQKELVVSLGRMDQYLTVEILDYQAFTNNQKGFKALTQRAEKQIKNDIKIRYVMEATGVYHESLAYFLTDSNLEARIV